MNFSALISVSLSLLSLIVVGYIVRKAGIIDDIFSKKASAFIAKIAQSFLIIYSIIKLEYSRDNLKSGFLVMAFALAAHAFMAVLAFVFFIKFRDINERKTSEFGFIFSNCSAVRISFAFILFIAQ